jgi:hypothetical protein
MPKMQFSVYLVSAKKYKKMLRKEHDEKRKAWRTA